MSQNQDIAAYLKAGKTIDPMIALRKFHCFRLASRISDLKGMGMNIQRSMVNDVNADGDPVRYAVYWLEKKNDKQ